MTITKSECFTVSCDKCEQDLEHDWIPHFPSKSEAEQGAMDESWVAIDGHVWCEECVPFCDCGHNFVAHNYDPCDECACDGFKPVPIESEATRPVSRCECARGTHDVLNSDCPVNWPTESEAK